MRNSHHHITLQGRELSLENLEPDEVRLVQSLKRRFKRQPKWDAFDGYWVKALAGFYESRALSRREIVQTVPWKIAQDLSSRLAIAEGHARAPDYRDELEELIRTRFQTRRAFCKATGLSEDLISHVLRKRKHLSIDRLSAALEQIGYALHIAPMPGGKS